MQSPLCGTVADFVPVCPQNNHITKDGRWNSLHSNIDQERKSSRACVAKVGHLARWWPSQAGPVDPYSATRKPDNYKTAAENCCCCLLRKKGQMTRPGAANLIQLLCPSWAAIRNVPCIEHKAAIIVLLSRTSRSHDTLTSTFLSLHLKLIKVLRFIHTRRPRRRLVSLLNETLCDAWWAAPQSDS